MATVYRVTAVWSGFQGAPGYSKFSFNNLDTDAARNAAGAAVRAYFAALTAYMVTGHSITVQPTVQEFDMATGAITGESQMTTAPTSVAGASVVSSWAGGSGFFVSWRTAVFFLGRRVQGRTFHVPAADCFDTDGTIKAATITAAGSAAAGLIAASGAELCVWAKSYTEAVPPAKPVQVGGALAPVTAYLVKDQASQLRSRRT